MCTTPFSGPSQRIWLSLTSRCEKRAEVGEHLVDARARRTSGSSAVDRGDLDLGAPADREDQAGSLLA